jgi:transcriptional regulator with XRE-family HTH domain
MTLKELRQAVGLTQTEVAARAALAQSTYSAIESGETPNPSTQTVQRLAKAFGVPAAVVMAAVSPDEAA